MRDVITRIVFLDLETTGFHEQKGCILELGMIVCDVDLNVLEIEEIVLKPTAMGMFYMDPTALKMHTESGLMKRSLEQALWGTLEAEREAVSLLEHHGCEPKRTMIAGNSVGFDVRWLREHMPRLHDFFHYRVLDMSSFHAAAGFWGQPLEKPIAKHRALSDAQDSLDAAKHYQGLFGRFKLGEVVEAP